MSDLERSLREGGEKVGEGRIRIDSARALQRLRDFRFADPAHWVLEVLRAAVDSGATKVEVETDADDVTVVFDGDPFPAELMPHLLEHALNPGSTRDEKRTRLLALGAAGALGAGAEFVNVESGGTALHLTNGGVEVSDSKRNRTRVHLHKGFGWRVLSGFFRGSPEARAIEERAQRFPTKLTLNRVGLVKPHVFVPPSRTSRTIEGKGFTLTVSLPDGPPLARTRLDLEVSGVLVASRDEQLPGAQLMAWVRADGLRRNASGSDVVEDDDTLAAIRRALIAASLELLEAWVEKLCTDPVWRKAVTARLLAPKLLNEAAKAVLEKAPVLPGPAGEWFSLASVRKSLQKDGRLHVATQTHPKGTYPEPTILLTGNSELTKLLPDARRLDVAQLVKQKSRIAENRARLEATPVEPAELAARNWDARGEITGLNLVGMMGFDATVDGAFVRVLNHGRLVVATDVRALAPLRLRAVVDLQRPMGDLFFEEDGGERLIDSVLKHLEAAVQRIILETLPDPRVLPHAFDLLSRLVGQKRDAYQSLPEALRRAPLFSCIGRPAVSVAELWAEDRWRYTVTSFSEGLLDGSRVLVLDPRQVMVLSKIGSKRLENVVAQLELERDVRRRMVEEREVAEVDDVVARVTVQAPGLKGEVGIPYGTGNRLEVTLLKRGLKLETTQLTARYSHAVACLDSTDLSPNTRWSAVARDDAFQRVSNALAQAQRELVLALVKRPRSEWRAGGEQFFAAFLSKELSAFKVDSLDDVTRAVVDAKVFNAGSRMVSLSELAAVDRLLFVDGARPFVPPSMVVLSETALLTGAIADALGKEAEAAGPELERMEARRRFEAGPEVKLELPQRGSLTLIQRVEEPDFTALAGLRAGVENEARVRVFIAKREYASATTACPLPLEVVVDFPRFEVAVVRDLSGTQLGEVRRVVDLCVRAVLRAATQSTSSPDSQRAVQLVVGRGAEATLPQAERQAVLMAPVFLCTDGVRRDTATVGDSGVPQYVEHAMEGALPGGAPVMVLVGPAAHVALGRWSRSVNVEEPLRLQARALSQRLQVAAIEEISARIDSPWRHQLEGPGLVGEVVIARERAGQLELYLDHKPLCVLPEALPPPFAAALESSQLTPTPGLTGVVENQAFKDLLEVVKSAGERLAREVATQSVPEGWGATLVQLAFQLAATRAWEWRGAKKKKTNKKKKGSEPETVETHPLLEAPLLRSHDGQPTSLAALITRQLAAGELEFVDRQGTFLEPERRAWWPRAQEAAWAAAAGFTLHDVSDAFTRADSIRNRFRFARIVAPLEGTWREPVRGPGLEGEVVIGPTPSGVLQIDILYQRMVLERWTTPHPVGGVAMVDGGSLTPNEDFSEAKRDAQFKALVAGTENALERLVLRRLGSPRDDFFEEFALCAVKWRAGRAGALGAFIPSLPLFEALSGARLTVGDVLELAARQGRVPFARAMERAPELQVLLDTPHTRALLKLLELRGEDVSAELSRAEDLKSAITSRRLDSLAWKGEALVRIQLAAPMSGELALSRTPGEVTLAREGIAVQPLEHRWPGVVGVVDLADLAVNEDWSRATPTRVQTAAIRKEVERLFVELTHGANELRSEEREWAASWALGFLSTAGVESPSQLRTLSGAASALADAPLFNSTRGVRVNLRAIAAEISTHGRIAVFVERDLPARAPSCVLGASTFDAPWVAALEHLFGKTRIWRVASPAAWVQAVREADPPEGTDLHVGLRALRKQLRLLRAGALGTLTPNELEDVRFERGLGRPLRYDEERKLVFLDPEHPDIERALTELGTRPERLWVLLTSVFGLVNRELERVTDADETRLLMALAGHLASNPKLLDALDERDL